MGVRAAALLACLALASACGDESEPPSSAPTSSPTTTPTPSGDQSPTASSSSVEPSPTSPAASPAPDGRRIVVEDSEFGAMLFDATGQAIYLFDVETSSKPECYGECAVAWPPVLTDGEPVAGEGVDPALLGTTKRDDGRTQVTYNDHPLYFYAHEGKREVLCHDVFLNGGNWYVVQPDGKAAPPG